MRRIGYLLAHHGQAADARLRQALTTTGLTLRQGRTLIHLAETGPVGQQALAEALGVDPSVLVAILNDLERDDLVRRRRDPADRRRHIVELTPTGVGRLSTVEDALAAVDRELLADLDPEEVARLADLLGRIRAPGAACVD